MTVNDRIKKELDARGWSCYRLAKLIKASPSTVKAWFQAVSTTPDYSSVQAVAKAFGMKVEDLVSEKNEPDPQKQELLEDWNRLERTEKAAVLEIIKAILHHNK